MPGTITGKKDIVDMQHRILVSACDTTFLGNERGNPSITLCMLQGEGPGAEAETSFEFHRQRFCYNETIHMFEKLKFPTRVCTNL